MPRFFIDLWECGTRISDDEGIDVADLDAARREAVAGARSIMCVEVMRGKLCLGCRIEVRDGAGKVVLKVPFREAIEITG